MSFWSGEKLRQELPSLLGKDYDPSRIDCAAYRLCIGEEVYISPREGEEPSRTKVKLTPGEAFAIPAGQFALLLTEEIITIPKNALGFISIRAKIKFRGLVNISGFHVDPGYEGRLIFTVFNASPAPIHLQRGHEAFLLWLSDLDRPSESVRKPGDGYFNIPVDLINPIAGEIQSLAGLAKKISETERKLSDQSKETERDLAEKLTALEKSVEERVHRVQQDHTYIRAGVVTILGVLLFLASRVLWSWFENLDKPSPTAISAPAPAASPTPVATPPPLPAASTAPPTQPRPEPQTAPAPNTGPRGRGGQQ